MSIEQEMWLRHAGKPYSIKFHKALYPLSVFHNEMTRGLWLNLAVENYLETDMSELAILSVSVNFENGQYNLHTLFKPRHSSSGIVPVYNCKQFKSNEYDKLKDEVLDIVVDKFGIQTVANIIETE